MRILFTCLALYCSAAISAPPHGGHDMDSAPPLQEIQAAGGKAAAKTEAPRVPIEVPVAKQARIGLKVIKAERKKVEHTIRTVGTVTADQTREAHVHTKINGWIERVYADYVGRPVHIGQPLFDLYSPDLVATEEEYLAARQQGAIGSEIAASARDRLRLWGIPQAEFARLEKSGRSNRAVTFTSPAEGFIIEKMAVHGMYITPEMELYRITDLSRLWIIATLYEYDIAVIATGDEVDISFPYDPGPAISARISYIYPQVEQETRTAKARIEVDNLDQRLKPGMFANIELKKDLGASIVVPDDAVIDTGARSIVFVKTSALRFEPREVKVGPRVENAFIILSGLAGGEEVVVSAHFLIDAESKFQAAMQKGAPAQAGHGGHGEQ
ncbi:MAG: efflux RND transporter periplasmic adaptor subunit [Gammaproteobacteria bacterium]|nr:efflux RND transporter periplasmic adaptor subunit [Gammaproteobacteria bacterium]